MASNSEYEQQQFWGIQNPLDEMLKYIRLCDVAMHDIWQQLDRDFILRGRCVCEVYNEEFDKYYFRLLNKTIPESVKINETNKYNIK